MPPLAAPKKKWGQNFLRNRGAVARIIEAIEAPPDELILEIGPGEGVLTEKLVEEDLKSRKRLREQEN